MNCPEMVEASNENPASELANDFCGIQEASSLKASVLSSSAKTISGASEPPCLRK